MSLDFYDYACNEPYARCLAGNDAAQLAALRQTDVDAAVAQLGRSVQMSLSTFNRRVPLVLLLHIGAFDALMLDALLTALEQHGAQWVTLEAAERDGFYRFDLTQAVRGRRNFLDRVLVYLHRNTITMDSQVARLATVCAPPAP